MVMDVDRLLTETRDHIASFSSRGEQSTALVTLLQGLVPKLVQAGHRVAVCEQVEDPAKAIGEVYRQLGLSMGATYQSLLDAESRRGRKHVSSHDYSLEEFGLDPDEIREGLADLFERYDWDTGSGAGGDSQPE